MVCSDGINDCVDPSQTRLLGPKDFGGQEEEFPEYSKDTQYLGLAQLGADMHMEQLVANCKDASDIQAAMRKHLQNSTLDDKKHFIQKGTAQGRTPEKGEGKK